MIHLAANIANIFWFFQVGLLWYAKPSGELWLIGSVALGAIWLEIFLLPGEFFKTLGALCAFAPGRGLSMRLED